MTRRGFLLSVGKSHKSPRNVAADAANTFNSQYATWAESMNKCKDGKYDVSEAAAFDPLPKLWRTVERKRRDWLMRRVG